MNDREVAVLHAAIHEINLLFQGDGPDSFDRESTLDKIKALGRSAEKILAGGATPDDLKKIGDSLHPQTQKLFKLNPPPASQAGS